MLQFNFLAQLFYFSIVLIIAASRMVETHKSTTQL